MNVKRFLQGLFVALFIVALGLVGLYSAKVKEAEATQFHLRWRWGQWSNWSEWGECRVESDHQCGVTLEGIQIRSRTKTCVLQWSSGNNQCEPWEEVTEYQDRGCEVTLPACEPEDVCDNLDGVQE